MIILAGMILRSGLKSSFDLITKNFTEEYYEYEITKISYIYFVYDSIVGNLLIILAAIYYSLRLSNVNFNEDERLYKLLSVFFILYGVGRITKCLINKRYLKKII